MSIPVTGEIDRRLLNERSVSGRVGLQIQELDVPRQVLPDISLLRSEDAQLPEVSQPEVVRYFTTLSKMNFSIDTNFYPLGSCTMKYNPKVNEEMAFLPGMASIHPHQPDETVQGALQLIWELQEDLGTITGLPGVCLGPLAGAQGEYSGLMIARAYFEDQGDTGRTVALVPDSAHGTNPASAAMAGLDVVTVPSNAEGNIDVDALRGLVDERTCVFMLTLPSTLGLFEPNILEITSIIHEAGGLVYADGANLNALLGIVKLGDLGFDIAHSNLHKTFSTPHGGGGPGAGPVLVSQTLARFLPTPVIERDGDYYRLGSPESTVGRVNGFHGSFGVLVRAYAYIRAIGADGMREVSTNAIINANYIRIALSDEFGIASDRVCMHECVLSPQTQKIKGVSALDISKRLIDYGIHPPTMYFPLIVPEALMVEPTETETKDTLDRFISVMRQINQEIDSEPDLLHNAPHDTPNTRLDEASAARNPYLRWQEDLTAAD